MIVARGFGQNRRYPIVTAGYGLALFTESEVIEMTGSADDFMERIERQRITEQNQFLTLMVSTAAAAGALHG